MAQHLRVWEIFFRGYLGHPCFVYRAHGDHRLAHLLGEGLRLVLPEIRHGLHHGYRGNPGDDHLHNGKNVSDGHHNLGNYDYVSLEGAHVYRLACLHSDPCPGPCRDLCSPCLCLDRHVLKNGGVRLGPRGIRRVL